MAILQDALKMTGTVPFCEVILYSNIPQPEHLWIYRKHGFCGEDLVMAVQNTRGVSKMVFKTAGDVMLFFEFVYAPLTTISLLDGASGLEFPLYVGECDSMYVAEFVRRRQAGCTIARMVTSWWRLRTA